MSDSETPPRTMTPFKDWDGRPKIAAAKPTRAPGAPFEGLPHIPKAPRTLSAVEFERAIRDTDRITGNMHEEEEVTPAERPFEIRVMNRLDKFEAALEEMKGHCRAAAEHSFEAVEIARAMRIEMAQMKKEYDARLARVELERLWVPRLVSTTSLVLSVIAFVLAFAAYQHR